MARNAIRSVPDTKSIPSPTPPFTRSSNRCSASFSMSYRNILPETASPATMVAPHAGQPTDRSVISVFLCWRGAAMKRGERVTRGMAQMPACFFPDALALFPRMNNMPEE